MSENLVKIYSPKDNMEADFIKNALEQANIYCFIQGYNHSSLLGGWNSAIEMSILVPEGQADEAVDIIDDYLSSNQFLSQNLRREMRKKVNSPGFVCKKFSNDKETCE